MALSLKIQTGLQS
ncbi:hypothetical protein LINPERPRIM_LOCUS11515 [Linum perenne]